jgi:sugar lactone lactonase YvrE
MRKTYVSVLLLVIIIVLLTACGATDTHSQADIEPNDTAVPTAVSTAGSEEETVEQSYTGKVPAPEFPNCIHIIPDLMKLEEKYADELVVIGVHSAKFENEGESDNIRSVILRYELEHPVINDKDFQVWNEYGARAWPTLVLIDPDGMVLGYHSGEGVYEPFDEVIAGMVSEFDELGRIDRTPLNLKLEQESQADSPLLFPGKVLADAEQNRLFIADSNHNRIVITDLEGKVLEVIGDGRAGLQDGGYESARFFRPQGITLADESTLYVADTENHTIRKVDLDARQVETVAGTGGQVYMEVPAGRALDTPLNSPWDVLYHDGLVYIAMAGQHQLWVYDPKAETVIRHAGSGREELTDGPLIRGGLNQPSGLATDGQVLYFADSEASAIRTADIDPNGNLNTIVGTGLFDFGDVDGVGEDVRLQHPLGVVYQDGELYVADTYNSKIKVIDPETRASSSFLGGDESGWQDGTDALFDEPGGLSIGDDRLFIADTNNHVIRVADLDTKEVKTLVLVDMNGLLTRQPAGADYSGKTVTLEPQTIAVGDGTVQLEITIPNGYKVNDLAPFSMAWVSSDGLISFDTSEANRSIVEPEFPLTISAQFGEGESELTGDLIIYYCEAESQSLCFIERVRVTAPVTIVADGKESLLITHTIELPAEG